MRHVYILLCNDNTYYTGITTDIDRRILEHNSSYKWAKYTSTRRPNRLLRSQVFENRSIATKQEIKIKKLTKLQKTFLIKS